MSPATALTTPTVVCARKPRLLLALPAHCRSTKAAISATTMTPMMVTMVRVRERDRTREPELAVMKGESAADAPTGGSLIGSPEVLSLRPGKLGSDGASPERRPQPGLAAYW